MREMSHRNGMLLRLSTLAILLAVAATGAAAQCTFTPNCDYARGSRAASPAASSAECCTLCTNRAGCAAGVWDGAKCWFKTSAEVEGGCHSRGRVSH